MAWLEINWHPDRRHLRRFGAASVAVFVAAGTWVFFSESLFGFALGEGAAKGTAAALWGLAAVCGILAAAWPIALHPLYLALSLIGLPIGWVVSHVVMAAIYYLVLTPTGLIMRLLGRDPLQRGFDPDAETYWTRRDARDEDAGRYFRQF